MEKTGKPGEELLVGPEIRIENHVKHDLVIRPEHLGQLATERGLTNPHVPENDTQPAAEADGDLKTKKRRLVFSRLVKKCRIRTRRERFLAQPQHSEVTHGRSLYVRTGHEQDRKRGGDWPRKSAQGTKGRGGIEPLRHRGTEERMCLSPLHARWGGDFVIAILPRIAHATVLRRAHHVVHLPRRHIVQHPLLPIVVPPLQVFTG